MWGVGAPHPVLFKGQPYCVFKTSSVLPLDIPYLTQSVPQPNEVGTIITPKQARKMQTQSSYPSEVIQLAIDEAVFLFEALQARNRRCALSAASVLSTISSRSRPVSLGTRRVFSFSKCFHSSNLPSFHNILGRQTEYYHPDLEMK